MKKRFLVLTSTYVVASGMMSFGNKPNVVLIVVDDLGWTDLGCYGSDLYQTPHIDELAKNGVRFTNGYAACTVSSPTRAALMTGKYPARIHCTDWITGHQKPFAKLSPPDWTQYMSHEEYTLAEAMKDNGYKTMHIGKWHIGHGEKYWPETHGFDINIGGWDVGAPQMKDGANGYFPPYLNPRLKDGPENEYLTERLADEAIKLIDMTSKSKQPFFLNLWFYNVHTPLQARKDKVDKYKSLVNQSSHHRNPVYAAMVEHVDDAVGKVMNKLKELGIDKNTIVIFTSDNGGLMGNYENNRQHVTSNYPLRSGKGDIYEGGVRVPFIVKYPDCKGGEVNATPVISMDIYPTVLSLTGVQGKSEYSNLMDGQDLSGLLLKKTALKRTSLFWHYPHYHLEGAKPYAAIRKGDWKLIQKYEDNRVELYNLKDDISESYDLSKQLPEITNQLLNDLEKWRISVNAQLPVINPNYLPEKQELWGSELIM